MQIHSIHQTLRINDAKLFLLRFLEHTELLQLLFFFETVNHWRFSAVMSTILYSLAADCLSFRTQSWRLYFAILLYLIFLTLHSLVSFSISITLKHFLCFFNRELHAGPFQMGFSSIHYGWISIFFVFVLTLIFNLKIEPISKIARTVNIKNPIQYENISRKFKCIGGFRECWGTFVTYFFCFSVRWTALFRKLRFVDEWKVSMKLIKHSETS